MLFQCKEFHNARPSLARKSSVFHLVILNHGSTSCDPKSGSGQLKTWHLKHVGDPRPEASR